MKTYKLNRNWYPFEEGAEFIKTKDGDDVVYLSKVNNDVAAVIPADMLDEIDNSAYWKPKIGDTYYYIDVNNHVVSDVFNPILSLLDRDRISIGNDFKTEKDAQAVVDWLKARQRLIESGARFINSPNDDDKDIYYRVAFDKADDRLKANSASVYGTIIYERELLFSRRELAERSIKEHKDDWPTYLGVKKDGDGNS